MVILQPAALSVREVGTFLVRLTPLSLPGFAGVRLAADALSNCQATRTVWGADGVLARENEGDRLYDPFQGLGA